jgi:hypothetical protein
MAVRAFVFDWLRNGQDADVAEAVALTATRAATADPATITKGDKGT